MELRVSPRHASGNLERYRKSLSYPKRGIDANQFSLPCLGGPKRIGAIPNSLKYGMVVSRLTSSLVYSFNQLIRDICSTTPDAKKFNVLY